MTVLFHRKLRNAGVVANLNIWEGMWHGFNFEPELPETREAAAATRGHVNPSARISFSSRWGDFQLCDL
jgi:acetyl esterase/lipase